MTTATHCNDPAEQALARIDRALDRLGAALDAAFAGAARGGDDARHERLRAAVSGALGQLDALIAAQQQKAETRA